MDVRNVVRQTLRVHASRMDHTGISTGVQFVVAIVLMAFATLLIQMVVALAAHTTTQLCVLTMVHSEIQTDVLCVVPARSTRIARFKNPSNPEGCQICCFSNFSHV